MAVAVAVAWVAARVVVVEGAGMAERVVANTEVASVEVAIAVGVRVAATEEMTVDEGQMGEGLVAALMEAHTTPPLPRRRPACRYQR